MELTDAIASAHFTDHAHPQGDGYRHDKRRAYCDNYHHETERDIERGTGIYADLAR